jgi:hypothetical protein
MVVPEDGRYAIVVNNIYSAGNAASAGINSNQVFYIYNGSQGIYSSTLRVADKASVPDAPTEGTIHLIENLTSGSAIRVLWDQADAASSGSVAVTGSSMAMFKLMDGSGGGIHRGQDSICVTVSGNASVAKRVEFNPFKNSTYSSPDFDTRVSNGITFDAAYGSFTVSKNGLYMANFSSVLQSGGTDHNVVHMRLNVNGGDKHGYTGSAKVDSAPDPLDRTLSHIMDLSAGDAVTPTVIGNSGVDLHSMRGTHFSMYRLADQYTFTDEWNGNTGTKPNGLISDDYTINTFSQDNLSLQYKRNAYQVPFKFGIRGPGTLRGGQANVLRGSCKDAIALGGVKLGEKKN